MKKFYVPYKRNAIDEKRISILNESYKEHIYPEVMEKFNAVEKAEEQALK